MGITIPDETVVGTQSQTILQALQVTLLRVIKLMITAAGQWQRCLCLLLDAVVCYPYIFL